MVEGADLVKVAEVLSRPLEKLIETMERGVGAVGRPVLILLTAHAEGRAKLIREGYEHRHKMLKAAHSAELADLKKKLVEGQAPSPPQVTPGEEDLGIEVVFDVESDEEKAATQVMVTHQDLKRRGNLMTICAEAADQLPPDAEVSDEPVDDDWTARFFSYAQDVSSEQLQKLWGKLLAREVKDPGSVPLRTLELLKNLTGEEARLFVRLLERTALNGFYLPLGAHKLSHHEVRRLQDAGLLESDMKFVSWASVDPEQRQSRFGTQGTATIKYLGGYALLIKTNDTLFQLPLLLMRLSAFPLARLVGPEVNLDYLRAACEAMNAGPYYRGELLSPASSAGDSEPPSPEPPASQVAVPKPDDT